MITITDDATKHLAAGWQNARWPGASHVRIVLQGFG